MANSDRPNGFTPIGTMSGSPWNSYMRAYRVDGSGSDIYPGDLVIMEDDGSVDVAATDSTAIVGVMAGRGDFMAQQVNGITGTFLSATSPNLDRAYYDASVDGASQILVIVGPDVLYEIQEDDGGTALTLAAIGSNADTLVTAGSGGRSKQEIDRSSITDASPATAQLRIVDIVDRPDNELGDWCRWIVRINENHYTATTGL